MAVSRRVRWGVGIGLVVALGAGVALGFGPLVRSRVAAAASGRALSVSVGGVRPGWFSVGLTDLHVRLEGVEGVDLELPRVTVALTAFLRPRDVLLEDGRVVLSGDPDALQEQLRAWRDRAPRGAGGDRPSLSIRSVRTAVDWDRPPGGVHIAGLDASRDGLGLRATLEKAEVHFGPMSLRVGGGAFELDAGAVLRSVKLTEAEVGWSLPELPKEAGAMAAPPTTGELSPPPLPSAAAKAGKKGRKPVVAEEPSATAPDAAEPLVAMPDLHRLRGLAATAATLLAQRLPEGATVSVEGLRARLDRGGEERVSLGPGPLEVERHGTRVEITFSTGGGALGTPMSLHAVLPSDDGDVELSLAGGQVPLSLLGLRAKALVDVDRATLAGKGRVVLDGKGKTLTFDGQLSFRGLAAREPRLSPDVVRGLDFEARARGVMSDRGELRLDEIEAGLGSLRVEGHGGYEQAPDHVAAAFDFDLPTSSCESIFGSIPTALVPTLRGAHMSGTLGARGRLAFDTRKLDDLALDYTVEDRCRLSDVPRELDRDRFAKPFVHRVYTPDGKPAEQTTGPTTDDWTDLDHISPFMQAAVLTTEDGSFFHHHGFNHAAIRNALLANLKARRFVRGASTITMQLAKNLFLSRDKTLSRKLEELILTDYLEQAFNKDEMMELYLNIIEFGPNVYGITAAADHYFGRKPDELDLAECMFLSSILPQPVHYHHLYERGELPDSWLRGLRARMVIAQRTGKITDAELAEGLTEPVVFHRPNTPRPQARPAVMAARAEDPNAGWQETN